MRGWESLARKAVVGLKPYASARGEGGALGILLDANESPWPPFPDGGEGLNRYPEPQPRALRQALAGLYGVPEENIFLGRGTDDAIDALVRVFCEAGRNDVIVCPPTYGMYAVSAAIQGAGVREAPLRADSGFTLDPKAVTDHCDARVRLVFLCSPNNPTGNTLAEDPVLELCRSLEDKAVVVVDEAYVEFSGRGSLASRAGKVANLVVLRTLSKAWALAGARLGAAVGDPGLIRLLQKVRAPYPISWPSIKPVLRCLGEEGVRETRLRVERLVAERARLFAGLSRCPEILKVLPSEANFLLVRSRNAAGLVARCAGAGIKVRDRSAQFSLGGCVRISVGTPEENDRLLRALGAGGR